MSGRRRIERVLKSYTVLRVCGTLQNAIRDTADPARADADVDRKKEVSFLSARRDAALGVSSFPALYKKNTGAKCNGLCGVQRRGCGPGFVPASSNSVFRNTSWNAVFEFRWVFRPGDEAFLVNTTERVLGRDVMRV